MQDSRTNDERQSPRFPYREEILIDGAKQCTCSDISEGGIFVSAMQSFEEGEILSVSIPFDGEQLTVTVEVRYLQPGIGMGVAFRDLDDVQKAKIRELIDRISGDTT